MVNFQKISQIHIFTKKLNIKPKKSLLTATKKFTLIFSSTTTNIWVESFSKNSPLYFMEFHVCITSESKFVCWERKWAQGPISVNNDSVSVLWLGLFCFLCCKTCFSAHHTLTYWIRLFFLEKSGLKFCGIF